MTVIAVMSVFLAVAAVLLVGRALIITRLNATRNLQAIDAYGFSGVDRAEPAVEEVPRPLERLARRLGGSIVGRLPEAKADELRRVLRAAGHYTAPLDMFLGYRVLGSGAIVALFGLIVLPGSIPAPLKIVIILYAAIAGWRVPLFLVKSRGTRRMAQVERQLPDLIELLVVTVEAGLGFSSALRLATDRIRGALGDELRLCIQEQELGVDLREALHNMLVRADTSAMRSFVRTLDQGQSMGVSIGTILRNLSIEMRKRRRQLIEERAQKAPIKMLFPMVFMIFPALLLIAGYPIVQSLSQVFGNG